MLLVKLVTGFNGLYGQDSHEYLRYTKVFADAIKTGNNPGDYFWPVYFPIAGVILSFIVGSEMLALQLVSMIAFSFSIVYLHKIIANLWPEEKNFQAKYLVLCYFLSPFMFRASLTVMSDLLSLFFITAFFYHFLVYKKNDTQKDFLLLIFYFAAALMTRYLASVVLLIPSIIVCVYFLTKFNLKTFAICILILLVCFLPHYLIKIQNPVQFIAHQYLLEWDLRNLFGRDFIADGQNHYTFPNIIYAFSNFVFPGFIAFGILLLPFVWKWKNYPKEIIIILSVIIFYALFLAGIPYQNMRYLMLTFPLIVLVFYPSFRFVNNKYLQRRSYKYTVFTSILLINSILSWWTLKSFRNYSETEGKIAATVKSLPDYPVYSLGMEGALRSYGAENKIISLYENKTIATHLPSFALVNVGALETQYKDLPPLQNWKKLQKNCKTTQLKTFENGWQLFEIK